MQGRSKDGMVDHGIEIQKIRGWKRKDKWGEVRQVKVMSTEAYAPERKESMRNSIRKCLRVFSLGSMLRMCNSERVCV